MKFSIIIPVYNSEDYLSECIESVLRQTFQDFEIILINDGSSDRSGEICENYTKIDPRIRVYHQINAGVSTARNLGLRSATGEWTLFLDSDDSINCHTLNYIYKVIQSNGRVDFIQFELTREIFDVRCDLNILNHTSGYLQPSEYCKKVKYNVCAGGNAIKTNIFKDNSIYFDTSMKLAEDQVFIFSVMHYASLCCKLSLPLYFYRHNTLSATNNAKHESMVQTIHKLEHYKKELPLAIAPFDTVIISFIYSIAVHSQYSTEYICKLMNSVSVRSVKNVSFGVKSFFYVSKISNSLAIRLLKFMKKLQ